MTATRRLTWNAIAFVLVSFVALETAYWLRPFAHVLRSAGSPYVELTADGRPEIVVAEWEKEGGEMVSTRRIHDESGALVRTEGRSMADVRASWSPVAAPFWGSHSQHPLEKLGHVLDKPGERGDWADDVVKRLRGAQGMATTFTARRRSAVPGSVESWAKFTWRFEDGRFVCRDIDDGTVAAGFGPDGATYGAGAATGERFDRERVAPALNLSTNPFGGNGMALVLVDPDRSAVHFVVLDLWVPDAKGTLQYRVDAGKEPIRIEVKSVSVTGPGGEPPAPLPSIARRDGMQFLAQALSGRQETRDRIGVPVAAGPEVVEVNEAGIVRRAPLDADETCVQAAGSDRFVWSLLPPVGGSVPRLRIRRWSDDGTLTRVDVSVPQVTAQAKWGLALAGFATLLRPPVLNAASFAGPRVADWDDSFTRWFSDPLVAGGWGGGWLAASLAVAAVCGWLTRRAAVLRRPGSVLAWTIAGAALGVAGLVWMRLVVPRSHVAACACGRRRAVHVADCPSCAAGWPAPERTGIEVFA